MLQARLVELGSEAPTCVDRPQAPAVHTRGFGAVAQLGERVVRNDEVSGSIPLSSTIGFPSAVSRLVELQRGSVAPRVFVCWAGGLRILNSAY